MIDLSIAIVAFQDEEDVRNAVRSIQEQTTKAITKKIYIIDNSIEPNNLGQLHGGEIAYLHTDRNIGFGQGHNLVLPELDSAYHAIVNPDILVHGDALLALMRFLDREGAAMAVPRIVDENGRMLQAYRRELTLADLVARKLPFSFAKKRQAYHTMQDADYTKPFFVPFAHGCFYLIRTEVFQKIGGFDPRYFLYMEDADLCRRVQEHGGLLYCPDAEVLHRWEKGSSKNLRLFWIHLRSMCAYFQKWGWKLW